jgi:3-deoxy-D-manno-octulosonic-acid transferase
MLWVYNSGIFWYGRLLRLLALLGHRQAKLWVSGRKNSWQELKAFNSDGKKVVWFHTASAGEFEQGRPVMEAYRAAYPNHLIALSFFSPSGFEMRKDYSGADLVFYLPEDTRGNAQQLLLLLRPHLAIFVKYEFWYHHYWQLRRQEVPLLLISAPFREKQPFFRPLTKLFWGKMLDCVTHFFVQDQVSAELLASLGHHNCTISGDTRTDRVLEAAGSSFTDTKLEAFSKPARVLVAGSTWPADEELLSKCFKINDAGSLRLLLVPHTLNERHLNHIMQLNWSQPIVRYSEATAEQAAGSRVMVLDTMGMLSKVYRFGAMAYVGGGFGKGIHNILEAAVYGIPVFFGPKHRKFNEALMLQDAGLAFSVEGVADFSEQLQKLSEADLNSFRHKANRWFSENKGATSQIMAYVQRLESAHAN